MTHGGSRHRTAVSSRSWRTHLRSLGFEFPLVRFQRGRCSTVCRAQVCSRQVGPLPTGYLVVPGRASQPPGAHRCAVVTGSLAVPRASTSHDRFVTANLRLVTPFPSVTQPPTPSPRAALSLLSAATSLCFVCFALLCGISEFTFTTWGKKKGYAIEKCHSERTMSPPQK